MPEARHITPKNGDVTMKGAFVFRANKKRAKWDVGGPYFPGKSREVRQLELDDAVRKGHYYRALIKG